MILNTTKSETEVLSGLRKAAMLLIVLGEQTSAELLQQLNEDEVQKVSKEVARITSISTEQAETVLNEFNHIATAGDYLARGGMDYARKLLTRAFNPDMAKRLLDRLTRGAWARTRRPSTPFRKRTRSSWPSSFITSTRRPLRWCFRT